MFGSLMIVFPTHHEGGALLLRHHGHEWIFDSSQALVGGRSDQPSIGYVAYLNDIEHEVAPVTSGHRVTLTYNLYFDDDGGPVSEKDAVSENFTPPPRNYRIKMDSAKPSRRYLKTQNSWQMAARLYLGRGTSIQSSITWRAFKTF
jgi:hypothetical protein